MEVMKDIMCHSGYYLENRLGAHVEAGRTDRRLLRKAVVMVVAKVVKKCWDSGCVLEYTDRIW